MNRFLVLILAVITAIPALAGDGRVRRAGKKVPGQYVVVLNELAPGRSAIAAEMSRRFGTRPLIIFDGFPGFSFEGTEQAAQAIAHDPRVAWVEENAIADLTQAANTTTRPFPPGWALDRTNQAAGVDGYGGPGCSTASGIRLYVVDTGITDVDGAEFGTRLRDLYRAVSTWSFRDNYNHGTAVASMAAGSRHGLARSAEVVNLKVIDTTTVTATTDRVIDAITRIDVDHYNRNLNNASPRAAVVNMSLYFRRSEWGDTVFNAVNTAVSNSILGCNSVAFNATSGRDECTSFKSAPAPYGLTYVVGSGNNNLPVDGAPASLGDDLYGTITVGATMMLDEWTTDWRAIWGTQGSNYGPEVDIWAPGTDNDVLCHTLASCGGAITRKASGTSMASPLVAGQVARLAAVYTAYTSIELENQLKSAATATDPVTLQPIIRDVSNGKIMHYSPGKCRSVG
jgi:hypothetical protein